MASINKVIIVGNLGNDPEVRSSQNGDCIANIRVATTEYWKDKQTGERQERTEWHRVNFWGRLAETVRDYVKKGTQVYIEGRLRTRKYTDKDGIEKYTTEIQGDVMQMLGSRQDGGQQQNNQRQRNSNRNSYQDARNGYTQNPDAVANDDIPF